jgi:hypothetical protein
MMRRNAGIVAMLMAVGPLGHRSVAAQEPVPHPSQQMSHPAVDSAAVARTAARDASRSSSGSERVQLMQRATKAWPTQPAYWQMLERAALAAGDSAHAARARLRLDALDVGTTRVQPDSVQVMFSMPDSLDYMESIAWDASRSTLLLSEMRRGTVWRMSGAGRSYDLRLDTLPGMSAVWAMRASHDGQSLWVSSAPMPPHTRARQSPTPAAAIWQVDSKRGAVTGRWALPDSLAGHAPGDLLVLRDGRVLVSDAGTAALCVLHPRTGQTVTIRHPLLRSPQGMVELPPDRAGADTDVVLLADYSHGLLRINLDTRSVQRVDDAVDRSVLGLDGMAWHKGQLVAVQNGLATPRVVAIGLDHDARRVRGVVTLWRDTTMLVSPTTLTSDGEALWLFANTQWDDYAPDGSRVANRPLRAARVVRLSGFSRR